MPNERVRMWRAADEERVLLMAGTTTRYGLEPRGEYVFGIVAREPMRARRGGETHLVRPGEPVAWDPHFRRSLGLTPGEYRRRLVSAG